MEKILMTTIKAVGLLFLLNNLAWAQLTPEQEEARTKGMIAYNMLDGFTAKPFLEIAAKGGDHDSQYYLAEVIRMRKRHISSEVRELYESAAEKGEIYAMLRLADDPCHIAKNCPPDIKTPTQWLERARSQAEKHANQGDVEAMYQLFLITNNYDWLIQAAQSGFPRAQYKFEALYDGGDGTSVMPIARKKEIEQWQKISAEAGYAVGMNNYANQLIARGIRIRAGYWTEKAAEAGHYSATSDYARWTAHMPNLVGYPRDLVKAYGLTLLLAEAEPGTDSRNLSDGEQRLLKLTAKMTPEQIEAGKAYANEWAKTHPPLSRFPPKYGF
jgi:hypothetical protein